MVQVPVLMEATSYTNPHTDMKRAAPRLVQPFIFTYIVPNEISKIYKINLLT